MKWKTSCCSMRIGNIDQSKWKCQLPKKDWNWEPFTHNLGTKTFWPSSLGIHIVCKKFVVQTHLWSQKFVIYSISLECHHQNMQTLMFICSKIFWEKCALKASENKKRIFLNILYGPIYFFNISWYWPLLTFC